MGLPLLKECMCGLSLRTGALVFGWLSLINSSLSLLNSITYTVAFFTSSEVERMVLVKHFQTVHSYTTENPIAIEPSDDTGDINAIEAIAYIKCFLIVVCIMSVIKVLIDSFLLKGIYHKNHYCMLPWIILHGLGCILLYVVITLWTLAGVFFLLRAINDGHQAGVGLVQVLLITGISVLATLLATYCYLVVYSHYRAIKDEKKKSPMSYHKM